jgi:hypothetical protein
MARGGCSYSHGNSYSKPALFYKCAASTGTPIANLAYYYTVPVQYATQKGLPVQYFALLATTVEGGGGGGKEVLL